MSELVMAVGGVMWLHEYAGGGYVFLAGVAGILFTMFRWWSDVIREAHAADHTPVVQLHQRYGLILFLSSEVQLFVGWFWAFFAFSLFPSLLDVYGGPFHPQG